MLAVIIHEKSTASAFLWVTIVIWSTGVSTQCTGSDRVLSLHRKEACFKTVFSLAVLSKTTKVEFWDEGLVPQLSWTEPRGMGDSFHSTECVMGTLLSFVLESKSAMNHSTQPTQLTHQCIHWVLRLKLFQFTAGLCQGDTMGRVPHLLPPLLLHAVCQSLWVQVKCRLQPYVILSWRVLPTVWNLKVKEVAAESVVTLITVQMGVCLSESETYWSLWVTTAVQNRGHNCVKESNIFPWVTTAVQNVRIPVENISLGDWCCAEGCVSISNISPWVTSPQGYQYIYHQSPECLVMQSSV